MLNTTNYFDQIKLGRGLYRAWVETPARGPTPLVCVWIDPTMEAFETEAATQASLEGCVIGEQAENNALEDEVPSLHCV